MVSSVSVRPLPSRPARPTISPRRAVKETSRQVVVLARQVLDLQEDLAGLVRLRRELVAKLAADHQADDVVHLQLGMPGGSPPSWPSRMTVISSEMRLISAILWEI